MNQTIHLANIDRKNHFSSRAESRAHPSSNWSSSAINGSHLAARSLCWRLDHGDYPNRQINNQIGCTETTTPEESDSTRFDVRANSDRAIRGVYRSIDRLTPQCNHVRNALPRSLARPGQYDRHHTLLYAISSGYRSIRVMMIAFHEIDHVARAERSLLKSTYFVRDHFAARRNKNAVAFSV